MNLHEYQGKQLFAGSGLPVSKGFAAETPKQAVEAAEQIGGSQFGSSRRRYTPVDAARQVASSW